MKETTSELLDKGRDLFVSDRADEAGMYFEMALQREPDNAPALSLLAQCLIKTRRYGIALPLLKLAAQLLPGESSVTHNIGLCHKQMGRPDLAEEFWREALRQEDAADTWANLSSLHVNEGRPERAIYYAGEALKRDPNQQTALWNMALAKLELGDFERGWDLYESGQRMKTRQTRGYGADVVEWKGEEGKRVVVYGEQGIGDEIMFASCLPDLIARCEHVVFDCHPRLVPLYERSFNIPCFGTRKRAIISWVDKQQPNAWIAVGSLPRFFRRTGESFPGKPYLLADEVKAAAYRKRGDGRMRIGISWAGGSDLTNKKERSIPLAEFEPLIRSLDADWYSLQYTPNAAEDVCRFEADTGLRLKHWPDAVQCTDYDETAAFVKSLDLVISVCTSVVHLAGAIGTPTWCLTPYAVAWRYGVKGERMPWYGETVRLFRQKDGQPWGEVIGRVAAELGRKASGAVRA